MDWLSTILYFVVNRRLTIRIPFPYYTINPKLAEDPARCFCVYSRPYITGVLTRSSREMCIRDSPLSVPLLYYNQALSDRMDAELMENNCE